MIQVPDLPSIPATFSWHNQPVRGLVEADDQLQITAGAETDRFIDPAGGARWPLPVVGTLFYVGDIEPPRPRLFRPVPHWAGMRGAVCQY
jgi:hypothetical protein